MRTKAWIVSGLLAGACCGWSVPRAGAEPEPHRTLQDLLPGYSIARCLFAEGRLVLEHEAEFIVLREGDALPGRPRVRVLEIDDARAVLAETPATAAAAVPADVPERLIFIDQDATGKVDVTLLTAEPPSGVDVAPEMVEPDGIFVPGEAAEPAADAEAPEGGGP